LSTPLLPFQPPVGIHPLCDGIDLRRLRSLTINRDEAADVPAETLQVANWGDLLHHDHQQKIIAITHNATSRQG
jgi:hypothetical protein